MCGISPGWVSAKFITHAVEDSEFAVDKLAYLRKAAIGQIPFENIKPDRKANWLNQVNPDFEKLIPLADRSTKLAKTADDEQAVFGLYSLGVVYESR